MCTGAGLTNSRVAATEARFEDRRLLGHGGMATVHEVYDAVRGEVLACKRLSQKGDPKQQRRTAQLFEREFLVLAKLEHPRIVRVHEYGIADTGPWFTMELLDGGDLQELAPLPWRRACSIARDVCSALSLLHSRSLIHRDVSPRNVRCTQDGLAKLIDFGALASMRPSKLVVGTPPCCAPEIVHMQTLDARTDLYALGATLYFSLVGHHAYPARTLAELHHCWREPIVPPSQLVADVPEALDALVIELLRLPPDARPASATEVIHRLCAIDGAAFDENLLVAHAYLSSPILVGRDKQLGQARHELKRMLRGRGGALLASGAPGAGKSMFLQACVRQASLLGPTTIQASAEDAEPGDYGLLRVLAQELSRVLPAAALAAAHSKRDVLAHAVPELGEIEPAVAPRELDEGRLRPELQRGLREWLLALSQERPLVLLIDDLHLIDEPSAALLALLALEAKQHALYLIATIDAGAEQAPSEAHRLFKQAATVVTLDPLAESQTDTLLHSVFGGAPNVTVLSHRLHAVANGNPRDVTRLAQHLVDRGSVRYRAGAWTLPVNIDDEGLPASMNEDRRARLAAASGDARELASALALCVDRTFSWEECSLLIGRPLGISALAEVEELRRAGVARETQGRIQLADPVWRELLCNPLADAHARTLHARLADAFDLRPDDAFRAAQHRLASGDVEGGLDRLVAHCNASLQQTVLSQHVYLRYVQSLPQEWFDVMERALALCTELRRPRLHSHAIRTRMSGILPYVGWTDHVQLHALLEQLQTDSGLFDWARSDPKLAPLERLQLAIGSAQARHANASEQERGLEPVAAIRQLGRVVISISGVASATLDLTLLRSLPSLAPLAALSPALGAADTLVQGVFARASGRLNAAHEIYVKLLARLSQPDRAGLDASYGAYMRLGVMNGVGMIEAGMGQAACLERATLLDEEPAYRVNAQQLRMLHHLFQGDLRAAERCKREVDKVRLESSERRWFEGSHLLWEVTAYALSDDLTHIQHTIADVARLATLAPGWIPVQQLARAEYERIRGDHAQALRELAPALEQTTAGGHQLWALIASCHVRTLSDAGRWSEAIAPAERYVALAEAADLGHMREHLRANLALVRAHLGRAEEARLLLHDVLDQCAALGVSGLLVGLVHEVGARIAVAARDVTGYEQHARACRQYFCDRHNPALTAKYERLVQEARAESIGVAARSGESDVLWTPRSVALALERCSTSRERARLSLALLAQQAGGDSGFLFGSDDAGPVLLASLGAAEFPESLLHSVGSMLQHEPDEADTTATGVDALPSPTATPTQWHDGDGKLYRPVLLSHSEAGDLHVSGVAVLVERAGASFHYPVQLAATLSRLVRRFEA
jgi:hypothetical protein